jgi:hypothetical protein
MFRFIGLCLGTLVRFFRVRRSLLLENLALRQQLAVLKRRRRRLCLSLVNCYFTYDSSGFSILLRAALTLLSLIGIFPQNREFKGNLTMWRIMWTHRISATFSHFHDFLASR